MSNLGLEETFPTLRYIKVCFLTFISILQKIDFQKTVKRKFKIKNNNKNGIILERGLNEHIIKIGEEAWNIFKL